MVHRDYGAPNKKQYELRYADGDRYRMDDGRGGAQKTFNLQIAIQVANWQAGEGTQLYVTDPETDVVLWAGQRTLR